MDDLSKETVSTLLVVAVILTITFSWLLLDVDSKVTVVQLQSYESQPTGSGDVKLQISHEAIAQNIPSQTANLQLQIQQRGG